MLVKLKAIWPLVSRSLGHSVTRSLDHSVTRSLCHSVTQSFNHWSLQSLLRLRVTREWPADIWLMEVTKSDGVTKWPNNRVTEWPSDRVTEWPSDRVTEWPSDRETEWQSDRLTEQPSDRVTEWLEVTFKKLFSTLQSTLIHYMEKKGRNLRSKNSTPITMA